MAFQSYSTPGLLPADNPLSQWVSPRRNALLGFGSGMLSSNLGDIGRNTMQGMALDRQYAMDAQAQEQEAQTKNATVEWLRSQGYNDLLAGIESGGLDVQTAWGEALRRGQPGATGDNLMSVGGHIYDTATGQWISPPDTADNRQNVSLTPQWGRDENGNWVMLQTTSTGDLVQSSIPEGVTLADPRLINMERAQGTAIGQAAGEAQVAAPADIASGQMALDLISQIRSSPELPWATGMSAGMGGNRIPGTGRYGFQNLVDQAKSGAFLSAIQEMRGMGALSNAEGQTATQAITRMDTALSTQDFLKALEDYEKIVQRGIERAQARISGNSGAVPGATPTGTLSNGMTWSIEQ